MTKETQSIDAIAALNFINLGQYLVVIDGPDAGRRFRLDGEKFHIGRQPECEIVIHDEGVSSKHCVIFVDGETATITDLDSRNGTFVDKKKLESGVSVPLSAKSLLQVGRTALRLDYKTDKEIAEEEEMYRRARTDALTGLANRHHFFEMAVRDLAYCARHELPMSLFVMDVDKFKKVNDDFGHAAGDLVLKELSMVLARATRSEDIAARWGGEEFVVLLRGYNIEEGHVAAERIRKLVERHRFKFDDKRLRLTVSIGLFGAVPKLDTQLTDYIVNADRALYRAKFEGRNRVCLAGD